MKILITGICGFAGSQIARRLLESESGLQIIGIDNFLRAGSDVAVTCGGTHSNAPIS